MFEDKIAKWNIEFTRYCNAKNYADSTKKAYWGSIIVFIKHFNTVSLDRINWKEIVDYILKYDSSRTIEQKRYAIQLFYQICFNQKNKLERMPHSKREKIIPQVLSIIECYLVFSQISNLKHKALIQLSYSCGLRISEVLNIKVKHIDGIAKTLFVEQSKGAKDRVIPLPEDTLLLLRLYFKTYFKQYTSETYLFQGQSKNHEGYSTSALRNVLKQACKKAKILKRIKFHTLRHSRATHWYNAGLQIRDIAELLGHNNIKTTEIYIHTGVEELSNKVILADEIIKSKLIFHTKQKELNDN